MEFNRVPHLPFAADQAEGLDPDALVLRIQPDEGITLRFGAKVPGQTFRVRSVSMDFFYGAAFLEETPEAYERLLLDALLGDQTLFIRSDEVAQAWRIVDPVLEAFEEGDVPLARYEAGTWGPEEADELLRRDGRRLAPAVSRARDAGDAADRRPRIGTWEADNVSIGDVERALSGLRRHEQRAAVRASVLTLVAVTNSQAEADLVRGIIHDLGVRHPSRTLVVVLEKGDPSGRPATAAPASTPPCGSTPWSTTGGRCASRRSRLLVRGPARFHLDSIVGPFALPDVPLVVWLPASLPAPGDPLLDVADRLVVDSRAVDEGGGDVLARAAVLARRLPVTDLSWIRLAPVAQPAGRPVRGVASTGPSSTASTGCRWRATPVPASCSGDGCCAASRLPPARVELTPARPRVGVHRRHRPPRPAGDVLRGPRRGRARRSRPPSTSRTGPTSSSCSRCSSGGRRWPSPAPSPTSATTSPTRRPWPEPASSGARRDRRRAERAT